MAETACRHFNGYKPCGKSDVCDSNCPQLSKVTNHILIVHLEAMGAVLRSTALLPAIKRKFPNSSITWITKKHCCALLENNPYIDRVVPANFEGINQMAPLNFEIAFSIDKSFESAGLLQSLQVDQVYGFTVDGDAHAIVPANPSAEELWQLGINDHLKFYVNQKSEIQLVHEALELGAYKRDDYVVQLSANEQNLSIERRKRWSKNGRPIVGINTGCANIIRAKRLPVEQQRRLIEKIQSRLDVSVVLLGGPEDRTRNEQIGYGLDIIQSPVNQGTRDGFASIEACDVVFSGDSLGMHMAIGLKKWVVAWFGPTCIQEIDLFDRGEKISTQANCSPCWKRSCENTNMCYDQVNLDDVVSAIEEGIKWTQSKCLSSKQHSSATPY